MRHHAVLLHVVRRQAIDVRLRVGDGRFIRVDAVDRHIVRAIAGAEYVCAGAGRTARTLNQARLKNNQVERVAPIERQLDDFLPAHYAAQRRVRRIQPLEGAFHFHHRRDRPDFHNRINHRRRAHGDYVFAAHILLKARNLDGDGVIANRHRGEFIRPRRRCLGYVIHLRLFVCCRHLRIGDHRAGLVRHGSCDARRADLRSR